VAVRHDQTVARAMLGMLQIIGNNVSVCDAQVRAAEKHIVRNCLETLEKGMNKLIADSSAAA